MINRFIANNNAVRLISLFLAMMIWLVALQEEAQTGGGSYSQDRQQGFSNIEIHIENPPEDMWYTLNESVVISLTLAGNAMVISQTTNDTISAVVDLADLGEGVHEVPIQIRRPSALYITMQEPRVAMVTIESIATKDIDVEVAHVGDLAENLALLPYSVTPHRVTLVGRNSVIESAAKAMAVVDLSYADATIAATYQLQIYDESGHLIDSEGLDVLPAEVFVTQPFEREYSLDVPIADPILPPGLRHVETRIEPAEFTVYAEIGLSADQMRLDMPIIDVSSPEKLQNDRYFFVETNSSASLVAILRDEPEIIVAENERLLAEFSVLVPLPSDWSVPQGTALRYLPNSDAVETMFVVTMEFEWIGETRTTGNSVGTNVYQSVYGNVYDDRADGFLGTEDEEGIEGSVYQSVYGN